MRRKQADDRATENIKHALLAFAVCEYPVSVGRLMSALLVARRVDF
jgi:hypothetical protein